MKFSDKLLSQTITQLCLQYEVDHVVISPGSRNAALTIGFTGHPDFVNYSIVDERCAAFFALGLAQQIEKPVALVCTSGSALLNYYPAIAEAFYSDIPLVVISADRPAHLIEIGDGQTIRQENVYAHHILYNANCVEGDENQMYNEEVVNAALRMSIDKQGPVHINAPFTEPLYGIVDSLSVKFKKPIFEVASEKFTDDISSFAEKWNNCTKKMILVGVLAPGSLEQQFIDSLAADKSVIVLTETTSNLHNEGFFPAIDQLIAPLNESGLTELRPDILLTFGGMVVSKKIKAFLRTYSPAEHWHIDKKKAYDTFFCLSHHFKIKPNEFFNKFLPEVKHIHSNYNTDFKKIKANRVNKHSKYENKVPFSDFKVFSEIFKNIPKEQLLQLGNSTTIRYAQLFDLDPSLRVFCNRGTSGIDGSSSTAIGAALGSKLPTLLVTGDLSFLYDSNALWNNYIPNNFRIIVINNSGGGIFRILPDAKNTPSFSEFFETKHGITASHLCKMYDIEYSSAADLEGLQEELKVLFVASEKPKLLEIFTPSEINDEVLRDYFNYIK